jgi:hypothetical protein
MRTALISALALVGLASCNGPKELAGREQDRASAAKSNVPVSGDGPNQRIGAAQDKADRAQANARAAKAGALESQAENLRTQADVAADHLEDQAKSVRAGKD